MKAWSWKRSALVGMALATTCSPLVGCTPSRARSVGRRAASQAAGFSEVLNEDLLDNAVPRPPAESQGDIPLSRNSLRGAKISAVSTSPPSVYIDTVTLAYGADRNQDDPFVDTYIHAQRIPVVPGALVVVDSHFAPLAAPRNQLGSPDLRLVSFPEFAVDFGRIPPYLRGNFVFLVNIDGDKRAVRSITEFYEEH